MRTFASGARASSAARADCRADSCSSSEALAWANASQARACMDTHAAASSLSQLHPVVVSSLFAATGFSHHPKALLRPAGACPLWLCHHKVAGHFKPHRDSTNGTQPQPTLACGVLSSDSSRGMSCRAWPTGAAFTRQVALQPARASRAVAAAGPLCLDSGRLRCRASACFLASCQRPAEDRHSSSSRLSLTCTTRQWRHGDSALCRFPARVEACACARVAAAPASCCCSDRGRGHSVTASKAQ